MNGITECKLRCGLEVFFLANPAQVHWHQAILKHTNFCAHNLARHGITVTTRHSESIIVYPSLKGTKQLI